MRTDLQRRAEVLAESLQEIVEPDLAKHAREQLRQTVAHFGNLQLLEGLVVYNEKGEVLAESPNVTAQFMRQPLPLDRVKSAPEGVSQYIRVNGRETETYYRPMFGEAGYEGALALFYDASYIEAQSNTIWRDTLWHVLVEALLILVAFALIIRWTVVQPLSKTAEWLRELRAGRITAPPPMPKEDFLQPFSREVVNLAHSLAEARAAAEREARLREMGESHWTPERLRAIVRSRPLGPLYVVSNREPYSHVHHGKTIEAQVPASGVVTALEPVLRACDGTWIAHGSGDADRETVGLHDRLRVPPEHPEYTLRRVWLTQGEEQGYYYGFANEGLWPLCHIAHTRPTFRSSDWQMYQAVNQKFADAVLEEMDGAEDALLLVQDYHFALLPRLIKEVRPDVRVAIFWHIPWPNEEAFGICPWRRELLDGLLGADLIGFHIQAHCNNFLETVDTYLESRIEWEQFAVRRNEHTTFVRPFPISVDMRESPIPELTTSPYQQRATLLKDLGIQARYLGVGVDRLDYTKGIIERFHGVERFLEKYPTYVAKFTFVQIGAPSRSSIPRYHDFTAEVEAEALRINTRFATTNWRPIVLLKRHHSHKEILPYYKAADFCMVTSLHDGMNLVAKEFVASRDDGEGALILSQFTGAARELPDAIIVNPYDTDAISDAILLSLEMDSDDRQARMRRMRRTVQENNVYRWAGSLINELANIRIDPPPAGAGPGQGHPTALEVVREGSV